MKILLLFISLNLLASPREYINEICKNIDSRIEKRTFSISYNSLNAFDRSKIKVSYKKKIEKITDRFHILKFNSDQFKLGDYDFNLEAFQIIDISTKNIKVKLDNPLFIRIDKKRAKLIAAKKEFKKLNLYVKVKFKDNKKDFIENYCNKKKKKIDLDLLIYEYSLNNALNGAFFGYEKIKYKPKYHFISLEVENIDKKHIKYIKNNLTVLNEKLEQCYQIYKGSGIKFYTLNISKKSIKIDTVTQTKISPQLEKCLDNQIKNYNYPILNDLKYRVYFSVVLSNLR